MWNESLRSSGAPPAGRRYDPSDSESSESDGAATGFATGFAAAFAFAFAFTLAFAADFAAGDFAAALTGLATFAAARTGVFPTGFAAAFVFGFGGGVSDSLLLEAADEDPSLS
jgi:hypothetical protein